MQSWIRAEANRYLTDFVAIILLRNRVLQKDLRGDSYLGAVPKLTSTGNC
jgi:hypothetical protein